MIRNLEIINLFNVYISKVLEEFIMKKWVCSICGYVYEGESAPEQCPICKAPADKFVEQSR